MKSGNELQTWLKAAKRIPWSAAKPFLKANNIEPSTGWAMTIAQLSSWDISDKKYNVALESVKKLFNTHLYVGEKLIHWHVVQKADIAAFSNALVKLTPHITNTYSKAFPLPIALDVLKTMPDHRPELTAIEDTASYTAVIFCSRRSFKEREEITSNRFSAVDRVWIEQYQQVVGYKKVEFQAYDVIVLDKKNGLLEYRIDVPEGLSQEDTTQCRNAVIAKFYAELVNTGVQNLPAPTQINFFPAIEKMYKADKEGSVFELYFTATTGSNNFGKMRNKERDLRVEAFHRAGADKVGITPYRLGIMWHQLGRIFHPELHLPGSLKLFALGKIQPLHTAFVRNCVTFDDYNLVSNRFLKYL